LPDRPLVAADAATFRQEFEREYARLFARFIPNALIEIMSWVVLATTETEPPARLAAVAARTAPAPIGERSVFDARLGRRLAVPVFERAALGPGSALKGPALIIEEGTTTYASPTFDVHVDTGGALVLTAR
jgi:N-methylhydantoinase A